MRFILLFFNLLSWNARDAILQNKSALCILIFAVVSQIMRGSAAVMCTVCTPDPLVSVTYSSLKSFFFFYRISCTICCFLSVAHLGAITLSLTWRRAHPCHLLELSIAGTSFWQRRFSHSQFPLRMSTSRIPTPVLPLSELSFMFPYEIRNAIVIYHSTSTEGRICKRVLGKNLGF